jgi:hypothetical protein
METWASYFITFLTGTALGATIVKIVVVFGLFLTMSPVFVRGIYRAHSSAGLFAEKDFRDGSTITTTLEDRKIGARVAVGIVVAILGTVINAFGDLIGLLL